MESYTAVTLEFDIYRFRPRNTGCEEDENVVRKLGLLLVVLNHPNLL